MGGASVTKAFSLKRQAFAQLKKKNKLFIAEALHHLGRIEPGYTGIFEAFRLRVRDDIRTIPSHINVWGCISSEAEKLGIIMNTEARAHMQTDRSHGRKSDIYVRSLKPGPANPVPPPLRVFIGGMFGKPKPRR